MYYPRTRQETPMSDSAITDLALWIAAGWTLLVAVYAFAQARLDRWEPAAPEPPDPHHH